MWTVTVECSVQFKFLTHDPDNRVYVEHHMTKLKTSAYWRKS